MHFERTKRAALFVLMGLSWSACSGHIRFERVEQFPAGPQINTFASAWANRLSPSEVSEQFNARYEEVWEAAKAAARRLEQRVMKAELLIDEDAGKIRLTDDQQILEEASLDTSNRSNLRRPSGSSLSGWKDEFVIQVVAWPEGYTTVVVSRVVLGVPRFRFCLYVAAMCELGTLEPEVSNGQIENWVLTQIKDELAKPSTRAGLSIPYRQSLS